MTDVPEWQRQLHEAFANVNRAFAKAADLAAAQKLREGEENYVPYAVAPHCGEVEAEWRRHYKGMRKAYDTVAGTAGEWMDRALTAEKALGETRAERVHDERLTNRVLEERDKARRDLEAVLREKEALVESERMHKHAYDRAEKDRVGYRDRWKEREARVTYLESRLATSLAETIEARRLTARAAGDASATDQRAEKLNAEAERLRTTLKETREELFRARVAGGVYRIQAANAKAAAESAARIRDPRAADDRELVVITSPTDTGVRYVYRSDGTGSPTGAVLARIHDESIGDGYDVYMSDPPGKASGHMFAGRYARRVEAFTAIAKALS